MRIQFSAVVAMLFLASCNMQEPLKIYGPKSFDGKDSVDYRVPAFRFMDQDSTWVDNATVAGKVYVADFFFTKCPSICPKMKAELLKVAAKYKDNKGVLLLSHTIDPARDSVPVLHYYAGKLEANSAQWHFLYGEKDSVFALAASYLVSAEEVPDAPGGLIHSGNFVLVDRSGRIRGYYDGTTAEGTEKLMQAIDLLLSETE